MKKILPFILLLFISCEKEPLYNFDIKNDTHADFTVDLKCDNQKIEVKRGEVKNVKAECDISYFSEWELIADEAYQYEYFTSYPGGGTRTYRFVSFVNKIKYEVTGSAKSVDITMHWGDGNTYQYSNVGVPCAYEAKSWGNESFVYISAQNNGSTGSVTCNIYHRDKLFKTATSSGAYVIATASGSIK